MPTSVPSISTARTRSVLQPASLMLIPQPYLGTLSACAAAPPVILRRAEERLQR
jgi:hypothetical protein